MGSKPKHTGGKSVSMWVCASAEAKRLSALVSSFWLTEQLIRAEESRLRTTAEKHELQLGHFSSLQPETLCEAMAPGPVHSAHLYSFTNVLAEESPHIITNDSPEPRRMG